MKYLVAVMVVVVGWSVVAHAQEGKKPDVVIILADDEGYGDLGCYATTQPTDIKTPNIDALAASGIRFTSGYVSCCVCSPSRAGMMTGRYQERFGHEFNPGGPPGPPNFGLDLKQITVADVMKQAGYATGIIGKWHLGGQEQFNPIHRGFDEFFGFLGGAHGYQRPDGSPIPLMRGTTPIRESEYLTDAIGREAVSFIDRHKDEPFFLYVPFNAVHEPLQAPAKYMKRFADVTDRKRHLHLAQLSALDDQVGNIVAELKKHQLLENTLIFYLSDNGGPTPGTTSDNGPLRGFKGDLWEGGIRIPFMASWQGKISPGQVSDVPVISLDLMPTAVALAGGKMPEDRPMDGKDLMPLMSGQSSDAPHEDLYWRYGAWSAIRSGDWKLEIRKGVTSLYNLKNDIGEKTDLATNEAERVKGMSAALAEWNKQLAPPLWPQRPFVPARRRATTGAATTPSITTPPSDDD